MLAVVVSPHRFTTALTSEASIVPGASYHRITPTACPGRVLGAASQVKSCFVQLSQLVLQLRVARPPPNAACEFPCTALSSVLIPVGGVHQPVLRECPGDICDRRQGFCVGGQP